MAKSLSRILFNKCPACGKGNIYSGMLTVNKSCANCAFDIENHDAGDGPAFFVISILGIIAPILGIVLYFVFAFSMLVMIIIASIFTIVMSVYMLRFCKSWLIHAQYKHNVLKYRDKNEV